MSIKDIINKTNDYQLVTIYDVDNGESLIENVHAGSCEFIQDELKKCGLELDTPIFSIHVDHDVLYINV